MFTGAVFTGPVFNGAVCDDNPDSFGFKVNTVTEGIVFYPISDNMHLRARIIRIYKLTGYTHELR